jgi:hypothetical protein
MKIQEGGLYGNTKDRVLHSRADQRDDIQWRVAAQYPL